MGGLVGGGLFSPISSTATSAGSWGGVGSGESSSTATCWGGVGSGESSSTATSAGCWGGVDSGGGSGLSFLRRSVSERSGSSWS